jgi:DNA-binding beta-propeller fold protein YncE
VEGAELSNKVYLPIILKDYPEGPPPRPTPTPTPTPEPVPLAWVSDVAVDPATERVFVASPRQDAVQVIDGVADEYSDNVPVGHGPTGLAVLTSTTPSKVVAVHAYAYNYWAPGVWFINASSLASHSMTDRDGYVGAAPIKVAVNSITDRAFVSNYYDRMALLNAPNETWIAGVPEKNFQASYGVDASQLNNLIYMAARDSGELIIFDGVEAEADPENYSPCHHAPPGADNWNTSRVLRMVAVNDATGHVFVTSPPDPNKSHQTDSKVFVLDEDVLLSWTANHGGRPSGETCLWNFGVTGGDVGTTAIPGPAWIATLDLSGAVSAGEEGIAVNSVTGRVYVTDGAGDQLFVLQDSITPANINLVTTVAVGDNPQGVDVNPESNKVYVANAHDTNAMNGTVSVVDGVTNVVSKTIELAGTR